MASVLETPDTVIHHLEEASRLLGLAHGAAAEIEGDRDGLIGGVRDMIFGLNTSVDALTSMIQEDRFQ